MVQYSMVEQGVSWYNMTLYTQMEVGSAAAGGKGGVSVLVLVLEMVLVFGLIVVLVFETPPWTSGLASFHRSSDCSPDS